MPQGACFTGAAAAPALRRLKAAPAYTPCCDPLTVDPKCPPGAVDKVKYAHYINRTINSTACKAVSPHKTPLPTTATAPAPASPAPAPASPSPASPAPASPTPAPTAGIPLASSHPAPATPSSPPPPPKSGAGSAASLMSVAPHAAPAAHAACRQPARRHEQPAAARAARSQVQPAASCSKLPHAASSLTQPSGRSCLLPHCCLTAACLPAHLLPAAACLPPACLPAACLLLAYCRLLAIVVTDPSFESAAASALVTEHVAFAAHCRLDYAASLVAESVCPPSVGGECALGTDVLEDRQEDLECLAAAAPHLVSMLLAPEGDPDAPDIPTPRFYDEAIAGEYSSPWQTAMDAEMAFWKSTGTYVDEVPPPGANIVSGMWIFRVKRPPGSPPVFKARYVARGFSHREGVDFFQTFSPTPKMTILRVLLLVVAQRDYELHSLDFSTAFLQGSLREEIWLCRPPGFTGSFAPGTQWSLRRPVYGLRQAPREWHDTLRTTLAALGFAPSTADPSLFLRTDTSLPPFYVLVYVDDLVFAIADTEALALVKSELQKRHTCTDLVELRSYLGLQITRDRARRTITLTQSHMVQQVLQRFGFTCTSGMGLVLGGRGDVVRTGHSDASWVDDQATQRSSQGYTFSLGSERPRSPPVLYVDNMAAIALCEEHRLELITKHIALRYFLARELQHRGQLRLTYVATRANTADIFTKALPPAAMPGAGSGGGGGGGGLRVSTLNGVKVYNVSGGKAVPEWISDKKKRALRKDEDYLRRIELIQDLEFKVASTRIKASRDGKYLLASGSSLSPPPSSPPSPGVYPPQVRVYELAELSLKFERNLDSEIVDFQVLTDDYSKIAFLCADRSVCFHAKFGAYFKTRIPRLRPSVSLPPSIVPTWARQSQVLLYDLRSSKPYRIKDHMYGSPIHSIKWHRGIAGSSQHIISTDKRIIKIWNPTTGTNVTSVEPTEPGGINDVCVMRGSGLIVAAMDSPRLQAYFIPSLGPAPRWCSFLENITEELEEGGAAMYDDYKFVTREELNALRLTELLGTNLLRPFMHGFFLHSRLYHKAKSIADPFAWDTYRQQKVKEKIEAQRGSRISLQKKLPKVNAKLAAQLMQQSGAEGARGEGGEDEEEEEEEGAGGKARKQRKAAASALADPRFASLFTDQVRRKEFRHPVPHPVDGCE
ncbi:unnamed protein product [Closterium sp. NIES-54]